LESVSSKPGLFRLKSHGVGKYGRVLGEIFIKDIEGIEYNINETLINEGHAYIYDGGKKKMFVNQEIKKDVL
jgi:endonuclease YncB( thermonuclease family)